MDLAFCTEKIIVAMTHTDKQGRAKITKECSYPLTAPKCVNLIITDVAVIEVTTEGLLLKEVAPGWTPEEVQAITEPKLLASSEVKTMAL